mmetsp:Transcript_43481/g.94746  ORF Transcript_43481/g.94746 Transcript_43481/m.94746 type:complete len:92 (-) Transcript_43481:1454-1729(-)
MNDHKHMAVVEKEHNALVSTFAARGESTGISNNSAEGNAENNEVVNLWLNLLQVLANDDWVLLPFNITNFLSMVSPVDDSFTTKFRSKINE